MKRRAAGAPLPAAFYDHATADVARRLLGHVLVSDVGGRRTAGRIVEVEAYIGPHDPACHAYGARRTARTEQLYGPPGTAYVYFTYGMHWCLNAVTEAAGYPAAVLIRALEPLEGIATMRRRRHVPDRHLCAGPARLCEALGVTGNLNGASLQRGVLRILRSPGRQVSKAIARGPRIGITRATNWPLRFFFRDSPWVSR